MRIRLHLLPTRKETRTVDLVDGATAEDALRAIGLHPDEWIPVRGKDPIPLDEPLEDDEDIKLISVVSGG
jgi:sulfur carrier protein ThiS